MTFGPRIYGFGFSGTTNEGRHSERKDSNDEANKASHRTPPQTLLSSSREACRLRRLPIRGSVLYIVRLRKLDPMSFSISHIEETRESFAPYRYRIDRNGTEFAIFTHNYRGECEAIELTESGKVFDPPFGMSSEFISGGGPKRIELTRLAQEYLGSIFEAET